MDIPVRGPEEMSHVAAEYVARLAPATQGATVIALSGELGAGKTTFTQAVARALGIVDVVNSPTFVLEKIYPLSNQLWQRLVHIDAYRMHDVKELDAIGWREIVADKENLICIEWPENVQNAIPANAHKIWIQMGEGEARVITYGN